MFGLFRYRRGVYDPAQKVSRKAEKAIKAARAEGSDAVFHGACHDCLNKQGNTQGAGMRYCLGCAYVGFYDYGENRRLVGDK